VLLDGGCGGGRVDSVNITGLTFQRSLHYHGRMRKASSRSSGLGFFSLLLWAAVFAVAYVQAPLYYSNQNQYFLHGLAAAGRGDLANDWLVNTRDPTPLFSEIVSWTYTHVGERGFEAIYYVLMGVYFISLVLLIDATIGLPRSRPMRWVFLALLIAVHSAAVRLWAVHLTGTDIPRFLQYGLAGQYLLGPGLQPSAFGVLLLSSMAAFTRRKVVLAAALAALACLLHATYLVPAAMLTIAYVLVLFANGRPWTAILIGIGTLVAVMPVVGFVMATFAPTGSEQYAEAQRILAVVRLPHHSMVSQWLDRIAKLQIAWIALGIALSLRTRLFPLLAIPSLIALVLTIVQVKTGNLGLALIFPWRISAVLVPVATAVILARIVELATPWPDQSRFLVKVAGVAAAALLAVVVVGGVFESRRNTLYPIAVSEAPLLAFIRDHHAPGDVYLIPASAPKPAASPVNGMPSLQPGGSTVLWDLQRFRLLAGAAIFVDSKAIPYKDEEVLEWHRRVQQAEHWFTANDWDAEAGSLIKEGITHVVMPAATDVGDWASLVPVYADKAYHVYKVR
jgi:hypothetical protein